MKSNKTYAQKKLSKIKVKQALKQQYKETITKLKELKKIKEVNAIVLFGSFARKDFSSKHSDLDIMVFLDKENKDKKLEEKIRKKIIVLNKGIAVHTIFQYKKIDEEDKSLMLTIAKEGKVIFSKKSIIISNNILGLKPHYLIKFDTTNTKPVIKNKLQRFLHGYTIKGKKYKGLIDEEKVFSAGKAAIIIPQELLKKILIYANNIGIKAIQKGKFYK